MNTRGIHGSLWIFFALFLAEPGIAEHEPPPSAGSLRHLFSQFEQKARPRIPASRLEKEFEVAVDRCVRNRMARANNPDPGIRLEGPASGSAVAMPDVTPPVGGHSKPVAMPDLTRPEKRLRENWYRQSCISSVAEALANSQSPSKRVSCSGPRETAPVMEDFGAEWKPTAAGFGE